jgi:small subunit ribosomal protein S17
MAEDNAQDQAAAENAAENADAQAVEAAHDAARALEAVQAEAATELAAPSDAETSEDAGAADTSAGTADTSAGTADTSAGTADTSAGAADVDEVAAPEPEADRTRQNRRKVREGIVVSDGMQATVVVAVVERVRHPKYGKTVQRTKRLYVHDAEDTAKVGDRVRVQETRPLSKLKRWRLTEVVERAR